MLRATVDAAIFWLENGLPLKSIKLVLYSDKQVAASLPYFKIIKDRYESLHADKKKTINLPDPSKKTKRYYKPNIAKRKEVSIGGTEIPNHLSQESPRELQSTETSKSDVEIPSILPPEEAKGYDYFISYAHTHSELINSFV